MGFFCCVGFTRIVFPPARRIAGVVAVDGLLNGKDVLGCVGGRVVVLVLVMAPGEAVVGGVSALIDVSVAAIADEVDDALLSSVVSA